MRRSDCRRVGVLWLLAASLAGCNATTAPTLGELTSIVQLKDRFNQDASKTRVVLLLTPT